jgi:hypothetical protein
VVAPSLPDGAVTVLQHNKRKGEGEKEEVDEDEGEGLILNDSGTGVEKGSQRAVYPCILYTVLGHRINDGLQGSSHAHAHAHALTVGFARAGSLLPIIAGC